MYHYNLTYVIMFSFKWMWNIIYIQWINKPSIEEQMIHAKHAVIVDDKYLGR